MYDHRILELLLSDLRTSHVGIDLIDMFVILGRMLALASSLTMLVYTCECLLPMSHASEICF
jgi:hypothetical protein